MCICFLITACVFRCLFDFSILMDAPYIVLFIGVGSIYKVGGPDAERRRCQRDGRRSERRGQKPLSTFKSFHLEVVNFVYFGGHFDKFVFPG